MAAATKTGRVCGTCGSRVDETSLGDLGCMVCLLEVGLTAEVEQGQVASASIPNEFGAYTIEHRADGTEWELGRGAMGVTYRAVDRLLDRPVALKIISADLGARSAEARERFMREARAAAALRHPNAATVYQFGIREETGQFFYAMELVEGETLEQRVRRLGPLDVLTTIDIALQVSAALGAAEERGLVHRDLKPGNLMFVALQEDVVGAFVPSARRLAQTPLQWTTRRSSVQVKVIDFGVAKAVAEKTDPTALTHGGFVGTPAFASPEQFTNAPVDVRSDIYSLGATLWFLLTGRMLFSGRTTEEIQNARRLKPLPVDQLKAARVPRGLISLLTSMLAIEPAARPSSARELGSRLQRIRGSIAGRGKTVARLALAAAIVAVATFVAVREFHSTKATPTVIPEKSIAVLPFDNLSGDPNNAYFAEGIQEEILTRLANIADLRVISRASTQHYQGKPRNLAEIGNQLRVSNVLEGSIQKAGDQVRVNVQLVNAQTDSHLWADSYDRNLTDILGVESEIAKRIGESLQAKLTRREKQALAVISTNNPYAYDAYLRGLAFDARNHFTSYSYDLQAKAASSYERAVQLDPNFAIAWARLSRADAHIYINLGDANPAARRDTAKRALENAQNRDPDSPETLLALGYYQYWVERDYGAAKVTFDRVSKMLPGSSEVQLALSRLTRRQQHWDETVAHSQQAIALDPRNVALLMDAALTYAELRQFPAALKLYDRVLDITPHDPGVIAAKAGIYQAQGRLQEAGTLLSGIEEQIFMEEVVVKKITQLRLERKYAEAIRLLETRQSQFQSGTEFEKAFVQMKLAFLQRLAGDTVGATITAEKARNTFERLSRDRPSNPDFVGILSVLYATMGEKESAIKEAERAIIKARGIDGLVEVALEENMAQIQTMLGENSRAIPTLAKLLRAPYFSSLYLPAPITPALLRLDPMWDPLRGDPAFQKLCEEK